MACGPPGKLSVLVYFAQAEGSKGVQVVGKDVVLPRRIGTEDRGDRVSGRRRAPVLAARRELIPRGDRAGEDPEDHRVVRSSE